MKRCKKCLETKPFSEFYVHPKMADQRLGKCKECTKADVTANRRKRADYYKAYDAKRAKFAHRIAGRIANTRRRRQRAPQYMAAHNAVARAVQTGALQRSPCQMCGTTAYVHAHHDDYGLPLDVMWLCPEHHKARHSFLDYFGVIP